MLTQEKKGSKKATNWLLSKITSQKLSPGDRLPTISEISQKIGVGNYSVRQAVNQLSSRGILKPVRGQGIFVATNSIHDEQNGFHRRIGFIVHDMNETIGHHILMGIDGITRSRNCVLEVANCNHDIEIEKQYIKAMFDRGVEGIVLKAVENRGPGPEYLEVEYENKPIVILGASQSMRRPHIVFDNYTAGREMTNLLIQEGCKRIAFYRFDGTHKALDDRLAGYKAALLEKGLPYHPELVINRGLLKDMRKQNHEYVFSAIKEFLSLTPKPDAIIAPMDYCAWLFIAYIHKYAPSELGNIIITGFDNDEAARNKLLSSRIPMPLWPTTSPDLRRMGSRATELLLDILEGKRGCQQETEVVLPCPLLLPKDVKKSEAAMNLDCLFSSCI